MLQPEPDGWDKKVACTFKNLDSAETRTIIHRNLTVHFRLLNFDLLLRASDGSDEHRFECTRKEANTIRDNLHLILTSAHTNVWLCIGTQPLHRLHEHRVSDPKATTNPRMGVLFGFGAMLSTSVFRDHSKQTRLTGQIKVWKEGPRPAAILLDISSTQLRVVVPIKFIQRTILVNRGHKNQPIQVILMLKSAAKIGQRNADGLSYQR